MISKLMLYAARICLLLLAATVSAQNKNRFNIYWNIPSFMCRRYNLPIDNVTESLGIIQNKDDNFRGDRISILYDPGNFPAILQNTSSKEYFYRNGGVPQHGNLLDHLEVFEEHVNELIPDPHFDGLAVIDFESWRPTYRQNFGDLKPYKDLSLKIERHRHPLWPEKRVQREAEKRFEFYSRRFMEDTLYLGQKLRPNATWGYYGLPYCFNGRAKNIESCPDQVMKENNHLRWLFESVDAIFPSVYMSEKILPKNRGLMVKGRVEEAIRLSKHLPVIFRPQVLVYHRYVYTDTLKYLSETETFEIFNVIKNTGADGIILWGSSNDLNTKKKCTDFFDYLNNVLGPVINSIRTFYFVEPIF